MKYKAYITCMDRDYRAYVGTSEIYVNSWDEAEQYCKEETWTGESYYVDYIIDLETKDVYNRKKEME